MCSLCQGVTVAGWRRGRKAGSTSFHVCLLYCKCYTLKAMLNFIGLLSAKCFLLMLCFCVTQYILYTFIQYIVCSVTFSRILSCSVCLVLKKTCSLVKVMLGSWMLLTEETEVLGKSSMPQAMQPTSRAATQHCTDSC